MRPVAAAVWGVGVWGEKHARVYAGMKSAALAGVHDRDRSRAGKVAKEYGTRAFDSPAALLAECDAVSVAVPTVAHLEAVLEACAAGQHVLVEKPMAVTTAEADAMCEAARNAGVILQVGQVERFNPALLAARPFVQEPKFIESHRMAVFQPRSLDVDVVFDLMIHDVDAVLQFVGRPPTSISAGGVAVLSSNEDIANARLEFEGGCVANLTASRVSQDRLRRIRFFTRDSYVSVDLFEKTGDAFVIKDPGSWRPGHVNPLALLAGIQRKKIEAQTGEPLALELQAFVGSVRDGGPGAASAEEGRDALRVAEDVRRAMKQRASQWANPPLGVS